MIGKLLIGAAIATCLAPMVPAATTPVPGAVAVDAEHEKLANDLARVLNSEELMRAIIGKMLDETLPKTFAASPDFAEMERDHPGAIKVAIEAMRPVMIDAMLVRLPTLSARLEPIYSRALTTAELHTLLDFYTSRTGVRVIKAMGEGADFSLMLGDMIANNTGTATPEGLRAGVRSGTAEVVRTATPEDVKAMEALVATSAGKKMIEITPQAQAVSAAWGNEPDPELDAQVQSAVKRALTAYLGKSKQ